MKNRGVWAFGLALFALVSTACDAVEDRFEPTVYKSFLYIAYQGISDPDGAEPGRISAFEFDEGSGALTVLPGSPFAGAWSPSSIVANPSERFIYLTDYDELYGEGISISAIDPATGALTEVTAGSPFVPWANSAAVAPSGKWIFAGSGIDRVFAFAIDQLTGALTAVAGSPFAVGSSCVVVSPSGTFGYAIGGYPTRNIHGFTIDPDTGELTEAAGFPIAAGTVSGLTVHPSGRFVYAVDRYSSLIRQFAIDASTGALTEAAGSPLDTSDPPLAIAVAPSGHFAYAVNDGSDSISAFRIAPATGALIEIVGSPFAAGVDAREIAISPSGKYAFVLGGRLALFRINPFSGVLTAVSGSPLSICEHPLEFLVIRIAQ